MYALFAFAAALAVDLFVRCVQRPTTGTVAAASAAAWLLPAVHPYGGIVVAVEARGRALPLARAAPASRLARRSRGPRHDPVRRRRPAPGRPFRAELRATGPPRDLDGGATPARGRGPRLRRRQRLDLRRLPRARGLGDRDSPPPEAGARRLGPHRLRGAAAPLDPRPHRPRARPLAAPSHLRAALLRRLRRSGGRAHSRRGRCPSSGLRVVAALSTQGINDPRSITYTAALGGERAVAEPAAWLQGEVEDNDILYPYSSVYLAALPETGEARGLPRAQVPVAARCTRPRRLPSRRRLRRCASRHNRRFERPPPLYGGEDFGSWVILPKRGPFADREEVLRAIELALVQGRSQLRTPLPPPLAGWFELNRAVICESLAQLGSRCGTE